MATRFCKSCLISWDKDGEVVDQARKDKKGCAHPPELCEYIVRPQGISIHIHIHNQYIST